MKNINPATAAVIAVGIVGVVVLSIFKVPAEVVAGYAGVFITVAGAAEKLLAAKEDSK